MQLNEMVAWELPPERKLTDSHWLSRLDT